MGWLKKPEITPIEPDLGNASGGRYLNRNVRIITK